MKAFNFLLLAANITEFGKARANPYARQSNNLKLTDTCECTNEPVCRDAIVVEDNGGAVNLVSVDFDGVTYTTDAPVKDLEGDVRHEVLGAKDLTDPNTWPDVIAWLAAIAEIKEVDPKITISLDANNDVLINHVGAKTLGNVAVSGGASTVEDRCCTYANFNQFKLSAQGAIGDIDWNGVGAEALLNNPYNYAGDIATDEATAAQLEADLTTALTTLGIPNLQDVSVKVDNVAGEFVMSYWTTSNIPATSGASRFKNCDAEVRFTCDQPTIPAV